MREHYYYRRQVVKLLNCDEALLEELEAEEIVQSVTVEQEPERVFSEDQVDRIRVALNLMRDLDVNMAGCGVILEMRESMIQMQERFDRILDALVERMKQGDG